MGLQMIQLKQLDAQIESQFPDEIQKIRQFYFYELKDKDMMRTDENERKDSMGIIHQ